VKIQRSILALIALCSLTISSAAHPAQVRVHVNGIKDVEGTIFIALCDKNTFLSRNCPYGMKKDPDTNGGEVTFEDIARGRYAVMVFQDKNNNRDLDWRLARPSEPWGVSVGDAKFSLRWLWPGPSFSKSGFDVDKDRAVDIRLE